MATATDRTTFDVPGTGTVTLAAGEPCPPAWAEHAPEGALSGPSAKAEPAPVTVTVSEAPAPAPKKK